MIIIIIIIIITIIIAHPRAISPPGRAHMQDIHGPKS
jgi:hypothetical protein